jgi:hypothetical protein
MDPEFISILLALYPDYTRVYGPYANPANDGRSHIILFDGGSNIRTISWPRAMMEVKWRRLLRDDEQVDHIDDDPTNDAYENFQVLTPSANMLKQRAKNGTSMKTGDFICPQCGSPFQRRMKYVNGNQGTQQKAGPFCGRSCAGFYNSSVGMVKRRHGST